MTELAYTNLVAAALSMRYHGCGPRHAPKLAPLLPSGCERSLVTHLAGSAVRVLQLLQTHGQSGSLLSCLLALLLQVAGQPRHVQHLQRTRCILRHQA